jgi:hypothetical protein
VQEEDGRWRVAVALDALWIFGGSAEDETDAIVGEPGGERMRLSHAGTDFSTQGVQGTSGEVVAKMLEEVAHGRSLVA